MMSMSRVNTREKQMGNQIEQRKREENKQKAERERKKEEEKGR